MLLLIRRLSSFYVSPFELLERLEHQLVQLRWYRRLVGGMFVKLPGFPWRECSILHTCHDGTHVIRVGDLSMHQSAVQLLEHHR